nr:hypothetical protein [Tanacetum cinerariifolium]
MALAGHHGAMADGASRNVDGARNVSAVVMAQPHQPRSTTIEGDVSYSQRLTIILLNEFNYLPWSQAITIALGGRSRLGFISGKDVNPGVTSPEYEAWLSKDQMVMSWILNSMERNIAEIFTAYLINRLPSRVLDFKCPLEVLQVKQPKISHLRVFGCTCFVHLSANHRDKLDQRTRHSSQDSIERPPDNATQEHENLLQDSTSIESSTNNSFPDTNDLQTEVPRRDPQSDRQLPAKMNDYVSYTAKYPIDDFLTYKKLSPSHAAFLTALSNVHDPKTFQEAQSQDVWRKAMQE